MLLTAVALQRVGVLLDPLAPGKDGRVELHVGLLTRIFGLERIVGDGVEQARAVDADGRFETHDHLRGVEGDGLAVAHHFERHVVGVGRDADFGVDELVGLAVGKGVVPLVGVG